VKKRQIILLILIISSSVGLFFYFSFQEKQEGSSLRVSGTIEATEISMSFRIPGILVKRLVDEGDRVVAGQLIATLDSTDQEIALDGAKADLAYARAVFEEMKSGSRRQEIGGANARLLQVKAVLAALNNGSRPQEIRRAKADLARAEAAENAAAAQQKQAEVDFTRYATLYQEEGVSKTEYDNYQTRFITAQNSWTETRERVAAASEYLSLQQEGPRIEEIRKAEAAVKLAEEEYSLIKEGPRAEVIAQARARVQAAEAAVRKVEQQLQYTQLYAPVAGVVLSKSAEPGEYLNPAIPVVTIGDVAHPWLRGYINEKDLGRIRLGQDVDVSTDSFPDTIYKGIISYICSEAEFTPKSVQTYEERVKLMFRIKVSVDNPNDELKPGMPADGLMHVVPRG